MLAGKGGKVLVLERNDRIGGCIRTEEMTAPGFIHDVMATTFVLFITSPAYAALAADLGRHGLEFCHTDRRRPACCGRTAATPCCSMDRAANIAAFNATAAGDGDRHGKDVGEIERNAGLLFGLLGGGLWSYPTFKLLAGEAWRRGPRGLAAFLGEALTPARELAGKRLSIGNRRAHCGRPGCCMPGSAPKMHFPARSPRSSPLRWRRPARRSSRAAHATSLRPSRR